MKLSDYVASYLVRRGIRDLFLVSGGGIMHLLDSVGHNRKLRYWCNYHEQACAIAAESYARVTDSIGTCLVTTGPGGGNAISGLAGAWVDSIPVLVISGQVRTDLIADYSKIRQKGVQEGNIAAMAAPVTKYFATVKDPNSIRYELEKAFHIATEGRPGPVWIEIPLDIQGSEIDPDRLPGYVHSSEIAEVIDPHDAVIAAIAGLRRAKRPLLLLGNGVRLAHATELLPELFDQFSIPVVLPYTAKDLLPECHPLNMGVIGTTGQRRANFALQNSDFLLSIGSGLCVAKTGFNFKEFARKAFKVLVDVDVGQLRHQVLSPDLAIQADAGCFIRSMINEASPGPIVAPGDWFDACQQWKERYPLIEPEKLTGTEYVNSYVFMDVLSDIMSQKDVLVTGNGLDCVSYFQAFKIKDGQRAMLNGNWGSMGWDLPAAVGACVGRSGRAICVTGDGSIQWNVQELLTIGQHALPIKVFVFNNGGYSAIRATQDSFFESRYVGADRSSGVANPDFMRLAQAYGLGYDHIDADIELNDGISRVLETAGPMLCEVNISPSQWVSPKASAYRREDGTLESRPLEDMFPFLPRDEVWENMHMFDDENELNHEADPEAGT